MNRLLKGINNGSVVDRVNRSYVDHIGLLKDNHVSDSQGSFSFTQNNEMINTYLFQHKGGVTINNSPSLLLTSQV